MKANTTDSKIQILVYGIDETGKPKAGRFPAAEAEAAKEAATSMKLSFCEVSAPATDGLLKEIPAGRIHAKGKGFVPFVKQTIYDQLLAEVAKLPSRTEPTASSLDQSLARAKADQASALPSSWDAVAPGHMVLFCEKAGDGFYEAIVVKRDNESLTLRFRDFPKHQSIQAHIHSVALVHPGI